MATPEFDAVIIGSGAGGAPIAHTLVKGGKSVLILEKGPLFRLQLVTYGGNRHQLIFAVHHLV